MIEDWVEKIIGSRQEWESPLISFDACSVRALVRDDIMDFLRPTWMLRRSLQLVHPQLSISYLESGDFHALRASAREKKLTAFLRQIDSIARTLLTDSSSLSKWTITSLGAESHNGGKRPIKLEQEGSRTKSVVIKFADPRPYQILRKVCHRVTDATGIDLRMPDILQQCPYMSWYALPFIAPPTRASFGTAIDFMRALGGLTCIAYGLQITDVHLENILIENKHPIIIDPECILSNLRNHKKRDRLYCTGMIAEYPNLSAIRGGDTPLHAITQDINSSGVLNFVAPCKAVKNRLILESGKLANPADFSSHIISGFKEVYRFLRNSKSDIKREVAQLAGSSLRVRAVLRLSRHYLSVMHMLSLYSFEVGAVERRNLKDVFIRSGAMEPVTAEIAETEWNDMLEGDVPYFWYEMDDIGLVRSRAGVFSAPWHDVAVRETIGTLFEEFSEQDMRIQCNVLRRFLSEPTNVN